MLINRKRWVVYHHKHNGKVFYVGMGRYTRPYENYFRSSTWEIFVTYIKNEYEVEIIKVFRLKSSARKFERAEIARTKAPVNKENRQSLTTKKSKPMKASEILEKLEKQI